MTKKIIHILFLLGFIFNIASAQEMHIKSHLDTNLIKIGEQVLFTIDVQYPQNTDVILPLMSDTVVDKVEILDISLDTILTQQKLNHYLIQYTLTSFDSGYYVIPSQKIVNPKNNDTLISQALILAVATIAIDSAQQNQIFDIKSPIDAPWTLSEFLQEYYPYLIALILLIAIIITVVWYIKKKKNKVVEQIKPVIPKEAAHVLALRELNALKDKKLWQNNRVKLYYIELSDIIRNYLENRFKISVLEQTSSEIYETIDRSKLLTQEQLLQLKQILSTADMAKFAKAKPLANENDLALKNAFGLIESTQIAPTESNRTQTSSSTKNTNKDAILNKKTEEESNV